MKRFLIILQFMTRIPVNKSFDVNREDYAIGIKSFPLIGLIIGFITCILIYISSLVFSIHIASLIGLIVSILLTGGIHLDGFSDTCDGIFSGRDREKILEIMKDSRLGTFGGVGLILIILSKYILYYEVLLGSRLMLFNLSIILLAPVISRSIVIFFAYNRKYARSNSGLGDLFIGKVKLKELLISQILLIIIVLLVNYKLILVYLVVLLLMIIIRNYIEKILEGSTGDVLGFSIEVAEIVFIFITLGVVDYL